MATDSSRLAHSYLPCRSNPGFAAACRNVLVLLLVVLWPLARITYADSNWSFTLTNPELSALPGSRLTYNGVLTNNTGSDFLLNDATIDFITSAPASSYNFGLTDAFLDTLGVIPTTGYTGSIFFVEWLASAPVGATGTGTIELSAEAPADPSSLSQSFSAAAGLCQKPDRQR